MTTKWMVDLVDLNLEIQLSNKKQYSHPYLAMCWKVD